MPNQYKFDPAKYSKKDYDQYTFTAVGNDLYDVYENTLNKTILRSTPFAHSSFVPYFEVVDTKEKLKDFINAY